MKRKEREKKYPELRRHSELTAEMNELLAAGHGGARLREIHKELDDIRRTKAWSDRPRWWNGCP